MNNLTSSEVIGNAIRKREREALVQITVTDARQVLDSLMLDECSPDVDVLRKRIKALGERNVELANRASSYKKKYFELSDAMHSALGIEP